MKKQGKMHRVTIAVKGYMTRAGKWVKAHKKQIIVSAAAVAAAGGLYLYAKKKGYNFYMPIRKENPDETIKVIKDRLIGTDAEKEAYLAEVVKIYKGRDWKNNPVDQKVIAAALLSNPVTREQTLNLRAQDWTKTNIKAIPIYDKTGTVIDLKYSRVKNVVNTVKKIKPRKR